MEMIIQEVKHWLKKIIMFFNQDIKKKKEVYLFFQHLLYMKFLK